MEDLEGYTEICIKVLCDDSDKLSSAIKRFGDMVMDNIDKEDKE